MLQLNRSIGRSMESQRLQAAHEAALRHRLKLGPPGRRR